MSLGTPTIHVASFRCLLFLFHSVAQSVHCLVNSSTVNRLATAAHQSTERAFQGAVYTINHDNATNI